MRTFGVEKYAKSLPTFNFKNGLFGQKSGLCPVLYEVLPTFIMSFERFCPLFVGFCPLLKTKVGAEKCVNQ